MAWRLGVGVGGSGKCVFLEVFFGYDTVNVVVCIQQLAHMSMYFWVQLRTGVFGVALLATSAKLLNCCCHE